VNAMSTFFNSELSIAQFHSVEPLSRASLTEYKSLNDFVSIVSQTSKQVETGTGEQRPRLVTFLEEIRDKTWSDIKNSLTQCVSASASVPDFQLNRTRRNVDVFFPVRRSCDGQHLSNTRRSALKTVTPLKERLKIF
jgi:hypothetical protein